MGTSHNKNLFTDYDGFVDKFKPKTIDDCYTPKEVYDVVLNFVREEYSIGQDVPIVRPFFPAGDFENYDYPPDCVVLDNPPFSIFTKIVRWYIAHNIKFFLFGPHLSIANSYNDVSYIICHTSIKYENGAVVSTSFVTNMAKDYRFWCNPKLARALEKANKKANKKHALIRLDSHVTTTASLGKIVDHDIDYKLMKKDCVRIIKCGERELFGSGYLMSEQATKEYQYARRRADEEIEERTIVLALSPQQEEIVRQLSTQ